jgi:molybdenum-dependent DNA-binding transcriptional regulator ModE
MRSIILSSVFYISGRELFFMDLQTLRFFVAAAEAGSFSAAAESLHYAQSNLSNRIKHLEEELKEPLFYRHKRGVHLTARANTVAKRPSPRYETHTEEERLSNSFPVRRENTSISVADNIGSQKVNVRTETVCKLLLPKSMIYPPYTKPDSTAMTIPLPFTCVSGL